MFSKFLGWKFEIAVRKLQLRNFVTLSSRISDFIIKKFVIIACFFFFFFLLLLLMAYISAGDYLLVWANVRTPYIKELYVNTNCCAVMFFLAFHCRNETRFPFLIVLSFQNCQNVNIHISLNVTWRERYSYFYAVSISLGYLIGVHQIIIIIIIIITTNCNWVVTRWQ
jgi:hypothetical protein